MSRYKIGFVGSQGSGKTTLAYELATELKKSGKDVYVLSEVARSSPLPLNEDATKETQFWIFGKQMTREQSSKGEVLITDRTLLDPLVYGIRVCKEYFLCLKPFVKEYMKTYDVIVYLPPNDNYLVDDGIRSTNKGFRNEIDEMTIALLQELEVDYIIGGKGLGLKVLDLIKN